MVEGAEEEGVVEDSGVVVVEVEVGVAFEGVVVAEAEEVVGVSTDIRYDLVYPLHWLSKSTLPIL